MQNVQCCFYCRKVEAKLKQCGKCAHAWCACLHCYLDAVKDASETCRSSATACTCCPIMRTRSQPASQTAWLIICWQSCMRVPAGSTHCKMRLQVLQQ